MMPALRPLPHYRWQTTEDWWTELSDGTPIMVPKGFVFAPSVPRFLWAIYPAHSAPLLYASCVHDYQYQLYEMGFTGFTRSRADRDFLYRMQRLGAPWLRRTLAYIAVRGLGWTYWYF